MSSPRCELDPVREALHKSYPHSSSERSQRYLSLSVGAYRLRRIHAWTFFVQGVRIESVASPSPKGQGISGISHWAWQLPITAIDHQSVPLARDVIPWLNLTFTILDFITALSHG